MKSKLFSDKFEKKKKTCREFNVTRMADAE